MKVQHGLGYGTALIEAQTEMIFGPALSEVFDHFFPLDDLGSVLV